MYYIVMNGNRIVILGAGFGGLTAAMELGKKVKSGALNAEVILIDKNTYHTYTPTLYEAATTSKETANYLDLKSIVTFDIHGIVHNLPIKFIHDEIIRIETGREGSVHLGSGYIVRFDYLILALGSTTNYFDIPGLKEAALQLKTFNDSLRIRDTVWNMVTAGGTNGELKIVVCGGGSTGVELASELKTWLRQFEKKHHCVSKIQIVEANPSVLFGFDPQVIRTVEERLKKVGVEILPNTMISSVTPAEKKIITRSGNMIDFDILIWTGGVTANPLLKEIPLRMKSGRAEVGGSMICLLQTPDLSFQQKIFAIGDIVCMLDERTGKPVPLVARAAINQAKVAAENIARDIQAKPHLPYKPGSFPYVIPVGGKFAVAKLGKFMFTGFWGWTLKGLVELNYLFSVMPKFRAIGIWLRGLKMFIQNDRLG